MVPRERNNPGNQLHARIDRRSYRHQWSRRRALRSALRSTCRWQRHHHSCSTGKYCIRAGRLPPRSCDFAYNRGNRFTATSRVGQHSGETEFHGLERVGPANFRQSAEVGGPSCLPPSQSIPSINEQPRGNMAIARGCRDFFQRRIRRSARRESYSDSSRSRAQIDAHNGCSVIRGPPWGTETVGGFGTRRALPDFSAPRSAVGR